MVKISIVVPIFNAERTLNQCIESVFNQNYQDFELILVNDGSQDGSGLIIDKYQEKYQNIIAVHKVNGGVANARNCGIEHSTGEYLLFLDSDDWLAPEALLRLNEAIVKYSADIIGYDSYIEKNGVQVCTNRIAKELYCEKEEINEVLTQLSPSYIWDKLFKKSIILGNDIRFDEKMSFGEDTLFYSECLMNIKSITVIPYSLYHYRDQNTNSLSKRYVDDMDNILSIIADKHQLVCKHYPGFRTSLEHAFFYQTLCIQVIYNLYNENSYIVARERRKKIRSFLQNDLYKSIKNTKPTSYVKKMIVLLYTFNNPYLFDFCLTLLKVIRKYFYKKKQKT